MNRSQSADGPRAHAGGRSGLGRGVGARGQGRGPCDVTGVQVARASNDSHGTASPGGLLAPTHGWPEWAGSLSPAAGTEGCPGTSLVPRVPVCGNSRTGPAVGAHHGRAHVWGRSWRLLPVSRGVGRADRLLRCGVVRGRYPDHATVGCRRSPTGGRGACGRRRLVRSLSPAMGWRDLSVRCWVARVAPSKQRG